MNSEYDYDAAAQHRRMRDMAALRIADDVLRQTDSPDLYPVGYRPEHAQNARAINAYREAQRQVDADDAAFLVQRTRR